MAYTRKFIILKKDFSEIGGNIKGHGKLEVRGIRGTVTINIENAEKESIYNVLFLSNQRDNPSFNLGKIFTDEWGKGKGEYNFLQRELENQGFYLRKVSALVVVKENQLVLGGYINRDDNSIENYISSLPKSRKKVSEWESYKKVEEVKEEFKEEIQEDIFPEEAPEETPEETPEEIEKEEPEEIPKEIQEENQEELDEGEEDLKGSYENLKIKELEDNIEKNILEEPRDLHHMKRLNQKNQTTMYILSILRFFPYIDPFKYNLSGFNWWLVELDKENEYKSFLPYFSYITGGNNKEAYNSGANCNELISKYNHYLFGLYNENEEVKYYIYGIPGDFTKEEHPNNGDRGFNTWYEGRDGVGYWILYIDPMTGKPVYPKVPMAPMDES